ncbi:MAG: SPFH domain-containing protein [Bacteroidaceae bacterium]|nr:SPFH domain-containing protein [Bacteroidaceae bacterium]MDO5490520.1 SPFH domain-containing protein [Bacteroidaceae bacterium]
MNGKEFDYNGSAWNGFLMFFLNIAMYGLSGWTFVEGIMASDADESCAVWFVLSCILFIAAITASCGFSMLEPNEAKVMTFFGKYVGTFRKNGFYWINPFMSAKNVSLRARNLNAEPIKVNDKTGNPVMIGLVLVWRLRDTYKAIFDIDTTVSSTEQASGSATARMNKFEKFVAVQSDSALREVAGMYAYDSDNESEVTLRDGSDEINQKLKAKLNERLAMAGMEAVEARINYLAYAPEIAAVMLRRQQAAAIIAAREKIVEGAVSMVKLALEKLENEQIVTLSPDKKASMVSNLLVVLCGDEPAQPVVNSGGNSF